MTDKATSEQVEREWFRRIVSVLLLGALVYGAVPIVKNLVSPPVQRR